MDRSSLRIRRLVAIGAASALTLLMLDSAEPDADPQLPTPTAQSGSIAPAAAGLHTSDRVAVPAGRR